MEHVRYERPPEQWQGGEVIPASYVTKLRRRLKAASQSELLKFISQLRALLKEAEGIYMNREVLDMYTGDEE